MKKGLTESDRLRMNALKAARERAGLKFAYISERTGINYNNLYSYEKRGVNPPLSALFKLAEVYGVTVEMLRGVVPLPEPLPDNNQYEQQEQEEKMSDTPDNTSTGLPHGAILLLIKTFTPLVSEEALVMALKMDKLFKDLGLNEKERLQQVSCYLTNQAET